MSGSSGKGKQAGSRNSEPPLPDLTRQENKPSGNGQLDMPELVFVKYKSLAKSSSLASDTKT